MNWCIINLNMQSNVPQPNSKLQIAYIEIYMHWKSEYFDDFVVNNIYTKYYWCVHASISIVFHLIHLHLTRNMCVLLEIENISLKFKCI